MRYLSVCSGIEAASVAWEPMGWTPAGFSEIEPFPSAVLTHHWPHVANLGDMTNYETWNGLGPINILVGGTPCQSFSVAGLRGGLRDPRGGLMLTYLEIARRFRPKWVIWENVPGVLSSNGGRDFGSFLGALGTLGYGYAYRVLDAQWIRTQRHPRAVPQRRRRVFVVGCLGDWESASKVLFERQSVCRNTAKSRKAKEIAAGTSEEGAPIGSCFEVENFDFGVIGALSADDGEQGHTTVQSAVSGMLVPARMVAFGEYAEDGTASTLKQRDYKDATDLVAFDAYNQTVSTTSQTITAKSTDVHHTGAAIVNAIGFNWQNGGGYGNANEGLGITIEGTGPLQSCQTPAVAYGIDEEQNAARELFGTLKARQAGGGFEGAVAIIPDVARVGLAVRRITPTECERLQGFPDGHTQIPWKNKPADQCPDGPRYKALGNSMAVNCMEWIGQRIASVEKS